MLYDAATMQMNSTVAAARARVRGPTLSEQREAKQREELEAFAVAQLAREAKAATKAAAANQRVAAASEISQS